MESKPPPWRILGLTDADYPDALRQIADPPAQLYAIGRVELLARARKLAVVGSRRPTPQAARDSHALARQLSEAGVTVVSGLALGVDAAAHRGALQALESAPDAGSTIAVLGTGIDIAYPSAHAALQHEIAGKGLLLSEFDPGSPPRSWHFPRRNRILSGLCQGVLVTEAGLRSGSLITARLAAEQGRDVLALPGSIHNPMARGCHQLLRDGAALVEQLDDIGAALGWSLAAGTQAADPAATGHAATGDAHRVLAALGWSPLAFDVLLARCAMTPHQLLPLLLELELQGLLERLPGDRLQRCRRPSAGQFAQR